MSNFWRTTKKWIHCSFFIAVKKLLSCSPFFFNVQGPVTFVTQSGAWACEIVSGSFQALASPYLAAAGRQKIQPQEMKIWGLKIVLGSFQALVPPYLAAAGRQKIQPQEMRPLLWPQPATKKSSHRKWESEPGKTFRDPRRDIFHYLGLQAEELWAKIWHGFPCFVDCENWEEQLSNFLRTIKKWIHCSFLLLLKSCSVVPLFFNVQGLFTFVALSKSPGASRPKHSKIFSERRSIYTCFQDDAVSSAAWLVLL